VVAKWKCLHWVEESWRPVGRAINDELEGSSPLNLRINVNWDKKGDV
jgi:hypothetical protein